MGTEQLPKKYEDMTGKEKIIVELDILSSSMNKLHDELRKVINVSQERGVERELSRISVVGENIKELLASL